MSILAEQIQKAEKRLDFDPRELRDELRNKTPRDLSTHDQLERRRDFLQDSMKDDQAAWHTFERIINGNELMSINYLERGTQAARSVARVHIVDKSGNTVGWGTGFLIAPRVFITNNHVLPDANVSTHSEVHFQYERDVAGKPKEVVIFGLRPDQLFFTSQELDFSIVAVESNSHKRSLEEFGVLPLIGKLGKVLDGEWLTIIQHPNGERKQICVRDNRLLHRGDDVLWYSTDTLGGSSGSPVFNNDWFVVALHHSGIPKIRNGRIQTRDGRDYDEETMDETLIHWIANEGIRSSRILEFLATALPNHPLLQPIFLQNAVETPPSPPPSLPISHFQSTEPLGSDAIAQVTIPLRLDLTLISRSGKTDQLPSTVETRSRSIRPPMFQINQSIQRSGFDENFLGPEYTVWLPDLNANLLQDAAKLFNQNNQETDETELKYTHFSVALSKSRRFAFYSAANVHFSHRWSLGPRADQWRWDERIPRKYQLDEWFYANNQFDRGHLSRHKDVRWGRTPEEALQAAQDSCSWTNCVPMHSQFNQKGDDTPLWFELEHYILEGCVEASGFKAQIITGPVLAADDPEYKNIQYPVSFWKIVAAVNSKKKLFATAYLLSQAETLDKFGFELVSEVPFGHFETYQTTIHEIELLTGLNFKYGAKRRSLSEIDPLQEAHRSSPVQAERGAPHICRLLYSPDILQLE